MRPVVGIVSMPAGSPNLSSSRLCHSMAAWPWVDPSVDTVEKARLSPEQNSSRPLKLKLDTSSLLKRKIADRGHGVVREQKTWLPKPPSVEKPRAIYNAAALAYMGDAIFELYVRRHFLTPPQSMEKYNQRVMALVCCEAQDALLHKLLKQNALTEAERDVLRWGRNVDAGNKSARRRAGGTVYNSASALETLIGYLYLTDKERLEELMGKLGFGVEEERRGEGFDP